MDFGTFKGWFGQVTTGIGALIGTPAVIGLLTHQITPAQAAPMLVASAIGLLWPENKPLAQSAQTVVADAEVMIPQLLIAYRTGLLHAAAVSAPKPVPPAVVSLAATAPAPPPPPPPPPVQA